MVEPTPNRLAGEAGAPEPSSTGLDPTLAAALAYLLGPISGIALLVVEKSSLYVRFHAMQSTITFVALPVIMTVARIVPLVGGLVRGLVSLAMVVLWVLLMVKAFQGERFKLPWVGDLAEERTQLPND